MAAPSSAIASSSSKGGILFRSAVVEVSPGLSILLAAPASSIGFAGVSLAALGLSVGLPIGGTPFRNTSDHRWRPPPCPTMGMLSVDLAGCPHCPVVWNLATPCPKNGLSILFLSH